jgi:hypothetical protein
MNTPQDFATALMKTAPNKEWALNKVPTNQIELDENLVWISEGKPPSFAEIESSWKAISTDKAALLAKMGLTADEAKLLLS